MKELEYLGPLDDASGFQLLLESCLHEDCLVLGNVQSFVDVISELSNTSQLHYCASLNGTVQKEAVVKFCDPGCLRLQRYLCAAVLLLLWDLILERTFVVVDMQFVPLATTEVAEAVAARTPYKITPERSFH